MLHPPDALRDMKQKIGGIAEVSAAVSETKSEEFWTIVKEKLSTVDSVNAHFYLEGYVGEPVTIEPGSTEMPKSVQNSDEQIIVDFIKRVGGTVHTTEDENLLEEVYRTYRNLGEAKEVLQKSFITKDETITDDEVGKAMRTMMDAAPRLNELDDQRDDIMRSAIIDTLPENGIGFLFRGGNHKVTTNLPSDIQVELLDPRLIEILREVRETAEGQSEMHRQGPEGKL